jgi:hypothetical protein
VGHTITTADLIALRPGHGVPPTVSLVGWMTRRAIPAGSVVIPEAVAAPVQAVA